MKRVLISGSNRGIGLELAHQCLQRGDRVFATCRQPAKADALVEMADRFPDHLTITAMDVSDDNSIAAAAQEIRRATDRLDLILNNAGILPNGERLSNFDPQLLRHTLNVNAVGPMVVVQQFVDLLRAGSGPQIINVTSQLGSLARKQSPGRYSYDSSKAALNMLTRALAFDLKPEGIIAIAVHPGWVRTDMGGANAAISPYASASGILSLSDRLTLSDSGQFYTWNGDIHPW